jgi:DNA-directed RNA polymerase subunit RPC12/RpoP
MGIFNKKKIKFVSAICPECNGHLELDANLETAFCQYCGAQCIVENAPSKKPKQNNLERVLDFVERQQSLRRQDRQERERRKREEEIKRKEELKKTWWIYFSIMVGFIALGLVMAILGSKGIV